MTTTLPRSDRRGLTPSTPRMGRRGWERRYARGLVVVDVAVIVCAVVLAQWLRFGSAPWSGSRVFDPGYTVVSVAVAAIWIGCLSIYGSRAASILGAGPEEYRQIAKATFAAFGGIAIITTLVQVDLARGYLAIALPLGLIGLVVGRRVMRLRVAAKRRKGEFLKSVVVFGGPRHAHDLAASLARNPQYGYEVVAVCQPDLQADTTMVLPGQRSVPVFAFGGDFHAVVSASGADTVAIADTDMLGSGGIRAVSWQLEKLAVDLLVSPGMIGLAGPRLTMRPVADLPLIHLDKPQYEGASKFKKRAFDVCFSALVLLAVSPLLLLAALAVKVTSRGPVFYRSVRIGMDGKPFKMIKLRTMFDGAEAHKGTLAELNEVEGGVIFKMRRDPRVTPVGRWLRRYSVDEVPQFFNVLRREMSVVGPRPPLPSEVASYEAHVRRRLLVRPGITGLWQVSGRSDLSWDDFVRLDLSYVENWSMTNDLIISAKTVRAVLSGAGAY